MGAERGCLSNGKSFSLNPTWVIYLIGKGKRPRSAGCVGRRPFLRQKLEHVPQRLNRKRFREALKSDPRYGLECGIARAVAYLSDFLRNCHVFVDCSIWPAIRAIELKVLESRLQVPMHIVKLMYCS